jgi:hypothetical protein
MARVAWCAFLPVVVLALCAGEAGAIPAFARKYRISCTTCHAPAPRLKPYGEEFAGNAFRLPDEEEPKRAFHDTGDGILTLQRDFPVAARFDAYVDYLYHKDFDMADFKTPYGLKLMSGGNLASWIGYYFYFYMSEHGEVAGIEDAYLHFNDFFGIDLDLMVGQFQVSDPLFKRELRLTFEDYHIYTVQVGTTPTTLKYDRGFMATYGAPFGLDAAVQLVNGNGKGGETDGAFDSDDWKNVFLRLSQSIGFVRVGAFTYLCNAIKFSDDTSIENEHYYWGVDGTLDVEDRLQINVQYIEREDKNPNYMTENATKRKTKGGFVEAIWSVHGEMGRSFVTLLYNVTDSEIDHLDYEAATVSYSYLLRRNLRLLTEVTYIDTTEETRLVLGMVTAF